MSLSVFRPADADLAFPDFRRDHSSSSPACSLNPDKSMKGSSSHEAAGARTQTPAMGYDTREKHQQGTFCSYGGRITTTPETQNTITDKCGVERKQENLQDRVYRCTNVREESSARFRSRAEGFSPSKGNDMLPRAGLWLCATFYRQQQFLSCSTTGWLRTGQRTASPLKHSRTNTEPQ